MSKSGESRAVPPGALFVAAGEELLIFPSTAVARKLLEAGEAAEGLYSAAYGPTGEPYRIGFKADRVLVERTAEAVRPDELKALLLRHLEACEDPADATQPFEEIVAIAWSIEEDYRLRCSPSGNRIGSRIPVWGYGAGALTLAALWYFGWR
ncbi:MAG: hypothetical protein ABIW03_03635 [Sphingomicrobium sp.]